MLRQPRSPRQTQQPVPSVRAVLRVTRTRRPVLISCVQAPVAANSKIAAATDHTEGRQMRCSPTSERESQGRHWRAEAAQANGMTHEQDLQIQAAPTSARKGRTKIRPQIGKQAETWKKLSCAGRVCRCCPQQPRQDMHRSWCQSRRIHPADGPFGQDRNRL